MLTEKAEPTHEAVVVWIEVVTTVAVVVLPLEVDRRYPVAAPKTTVRTTNTAAIDLKFKAVHRLGSFGI